jgi:magnesium-transporting ATPase (P-type)
LCFTALPIIWFAVYDWEHSKEQLLENPKLYKIGLDNIYFNSWVFWRWFLRAVYQGIVLLVVTYDTLGENAEGSSLYLEGTVIVTASVLIANLRVILGSYEWTFWMFFWNLGSTLFYIGFFWFFSESDTSNLCGIF